MPDTDDFWNARVELDKWMEENMCIGRAQNTDPVRVQREAGLEGLREFQKRVDAVFEEAHVYCEAKKSESR